MAKPERKRPAVTFYPKEWIWDIELRQCSPAARGLWVDLLCIMHEGNPYGHLTAPEELVLRMTGLSADEYRELLADLEGDKASGKRVAYRTDAGILYSKRMVRDEEDRITRKINGETGGNPKLGEHYHRAGCLYLIRRESDRATKIGIAVNPSARLYKLRAASGGDHLSLIYSASVDDMGTSEKALHDRYSAKKVSGEWFDLTDGDISQIKSSLNHTPISEHETNRREDISTKDSKKKEDARTAEFRDTYPAHRLDNAGAQLFIGSSPELQDEILAGLRLWVKSTAWTEADGKFVNRASNFITEKIYQMKPVAAAVTKPTPYFDPRKAGIID